MNIKDLPCIFHVLSNKTRLEVYKLILKEASACSEVGEEGVPENCVGEIARKLRLNQPTVSNHIKELISVNLIVSRKVGKYTYFFGVERTAKQLSAFSKFVSDELDRVPSTAK